MKKLLLSLVSIFLTIGLVACGKDNSPEVQGIVHHWMHGAVGANVTANINFKEADRSSLEVAFGEQKLVAELDYEISNSDVLKIFGEKLEDLELKLGANIFKVTTNLGSSDFIVTVVDDPTDTTIETKDITLMDMSQNAEHKPTAPIANAPKLLITEIGVDSGIYSYFEVFNNTASEMNLKGKRIVFANTENQNYLNAENGFLAEEPIGMSSSAYIYRDYKIPALSSAIIWYIGNAPWSVTNGVLSESSDAEKYLFGDKEENLSIEKFKNYHNIDQNVLIFPVRAQYMLMNSTFNYDNETGYGVVLAKSGTNIFNGFNSVVPHRMIQIQDTDQETKHPVGSDTAAPAGSTYFKYEMGVLNQEEDVYVNGVLDKTKIVKTGIASAAREFINGLYFRKVYYNDSNAKVGYSTSGTVNFDMYNSDKQPYLDALKASTKAIVAAHLYPKIEEGEAINWGAKTSLEYTIPAANSIFMRFIAHGTAAVYDTLYAENGSDASNIAAAKAITKAGIINVIEGVYVTRTVKVPVDGAYPTDYLAKYKINTAGYSAWYNLGTTKP